MNTNRISEPSFLIIPVKSSIQEKKQLTTCDNYVSLSMVNVANWNAILCSVNHILFTLVGVITAAIYEGITESSTINTYMHGIQT
jgi:hypothetical protein